VDALVRKITVEITTSYADGAGTEGAVFLGLGGREFRLDIDDYEDFDRGDEHAYELGEDANVRFADRNDPRQGMPLSLADIASRPAYLRLEPRGKSDDWNVASVTVRVVAGSETVRYGALQGSNESIWLGPQSGTTLHLKKLP
jgi:hypothetical protein